MASKKRNNQDGAFAQSFKPALILGGPTSAAMLNQVFLKQGQEVFEAEGNHMVYMNLGYDGTTDNPAASPRYILETVNPLVNPIIRKVTVKGKKDFTNSYVFEAGDNVHGIILVLLKELTDKGLVYCNVRYLPFVSFLDIISAQNNKELQVIIPSTDVIKLNITIKSSNTGEVLFKTHKTQVLLENVTEEGVIAIQKALEFQGASYVAHFARMFFNESPTQNATGGLKLNLDADFPERSTIKKGLLSVAMISTAIAFTANHRANIPVPVNPRLRIVGTLFGAIGAITGLASGWPND